MKYKKVILRACKDEPIIRYVAKDKDGMMTVRSEGSYVQMEKGQRMNDWMAE